jgi:acyl carrier protein
MGILSSLFGRKAPRHLRGRHREIINAYYDLREKVGDPLTQSRRDVIEKIIRIELKISPKKKIKPEMSLMKDLGCCDLDLVELIMTIEDQFDGTLTYPEWEDHNLYKVTIADLLNGR